jgi:hypothetical protein
LDLASENTDLLASLASVLKNLLTPDYSNSNFLSQYAHTKNNTTNITNLDITLVLLTRTLGCFTLDVIGGTGFSFQTNSLENEDNEFLRCVAEVQKQLLNPTLPITLACKYNGTSVQ